MRRTHPEIEALPVDAARQLYVGVHPDAEGDNGLDAPLAELPLAIA